MRNGRWIITQRGQHLQRKLSAQFVWHTLLVRKTDSWINTIATSSSLKNLVVSKVSSPQSRCFVCSLLYMRYASIRDISHQAEALAFWYGAKLITVGTITDSGIVITYPHIYLIDVSVFFAVLIGTFSVAEIAPNLQAFTLALSACSKIYETIDRVPKIDVYSPDGKRPEKVDGILEFRNVNLIFPPRPEVQVLENINIVIPHGKTTALVGASGSGKSTIVGLVERWYDPLEGDILLDGVDLRDLNLKWLRNQISLVSQ